MPYRAYNHKCTCNAGRKFAEYCPDCNIKGEAIGWGYNMVGNMGQYIRQTGFAPIGYHRHLVDMLFYEHWEKCQDCDGVGIIDADNYQGWKNCSNCDRKGGFYIGGKFDWDRMIYEVLSAYPDSASGDFKSEYNRTYNKYKDELDLPESIQSDDDKIMSNNRNKGSMFF
jgi:hypothetical protein